MKRIFSLALVTLVMLVSSYASAQNHHDNIWIFSNVINASIFDFTSGDVRVDSIETDLVLEGASASICDERGNLKFYTNGCRIYNWRHELMDGGEGLNPGEVYEEQCIGENRYRLGYPGHVQSSTIIPWPEREEKYLLFHTRTIFQYDSIGTRLNSTVDQLFYTIVDMELSNGDGTVAEKNIPLDSANLEPTLVLNRHANGIDWWLINPIADTNLFKVYLVDSLGVRFHHEQSIGLTDSRSVRAGDQSIFTPFGDQFIRFGRLQGLSLFDFDRTTGRFSNFQSISFPQSEPQMAIFGGVAVSPSGQFAYVTNRTEVYQYDLWAEDIAASQYQIAELVDDGSMLLPPTTQNMQLGPDCKIYSYMVNGNQHHVIHNPDERGDACGWEQGGMQLGRYVFRDQPLFPNYRLGPLGDEGSPCAEPIVSVAEGGNNETFSPAKVYPNPAGAVLFYSVADDVVTLVELHDGLGRLLRVNKTRLLAESVGRLPLEGLSPGTYALRLRLESGRLVVKKIVVQRGN